MSFATGCIHAGCGCKYWHSAGRLCEKCGHTQISPGEVVPRAKFKQVLMAEPAHSEAARNENSNPLFRDARATERAKYAGLSFGEILFAALARIHALESDVGRLEDECRESRRR